MAFDFGSFGNSFKSGGIAGAGNGIGQLLSMLLGSGGGGGSLGIGKTEGPDQGSGEGTVSGTGGMAGALGGIGSMLKGSGGGGSGKPAGQVDIAHPGYQLPAPQDLGANPNAMQSLSDDAALQQAIMELLKRKVGQNA